MDSKQHQQLCDLAQGLKKGSSLSEDGILAVLTAYLESPTLFNGGLAVLAIQTFFAVEEHVRARRTVTRILREGVELIRDADSNAWEHKARLVRMRHLMNVIKVSLTQRKVVAPQLQGIIALCEADRVMRGPPDERRKTWEEHAYSRHVPQAGGCETNDGLHSAYGWPPGCVDAFELASFLALRRGTLRELAFGVNHSDRPKSNRAALIRRFWQISRSPWSAAQ